MAVETLGVFGPEACGLVKDLGRHIAHFGATVLSLFATENFDSGAEGKCCGYSELHQFHL